MHLTLLCLFLSAVVISADLQKDIKEIIDRFPKPNLQNSLVQKYPGSHAHPRSLSKEVEVDYNNALEEFLQVPEVKDLFQYFERRGIRAQEILISLLSAQAHDGLITNEASSGEILANIFGYLSTPEVQKIIKQKIETDPEFANLAAALREPEFKALFYRALNSKASLDCANCNGLKVRGFWKKVWNKVKQTKFGINFVVPVGK